MLFNSIEFFIFLAVVFVLYWALSHKSLKWQNCLLLAASYFFYGWWSWKFLILLIVSTLLDYLYGFGVASDDKRKSRLFLWLSIVNNLGILAVFKYYDFFALQLREALALLGLHSNPVLLQVALPVGISFYTFHGMSYVFDIYRGRRRPVRNFIDYGLFVSFFPLLVAGPIERANHLLPQIQAKRVFSYSKAVEGCRSMLWGMFKKVVIADSLSVIVDKIFASYADQNAYGLIIGAIGFSFQIYADFSGYSDIALGAAKLFGFELLSNFKFPYFSRDMAEFWRRWHISLSSWFRDYLYIPLGGSREGKAKAIRNTFIIFIVSGFWHGASWSFIVWGFIHACGFLPLLLSNRHRTHVAHVVAYDRKLPTLKELGQMIATFAFVAFAWIFFRAKDISTAWAYIKRILTGIWKDPGQFLKIPADKEVFFYAGVLLLLDWAFRRDERLPAFKYAFFKYAFYLSAGVLVFLYFGKKANFIYFQF